MSYICIKHISMPIIEHTMTIIYRILLLVVILKDYIPTDDSDAESVAT